MIRRAPRILLPGVGAAVAAMRDAGFGAMEMLPLWPRAGMAAKRVLLRARKGARGPARILPGLLLHEADGRFSKAADAILRDAAEIAAP